MGRQSMPVAPPTRMMGLCPQCCRWRSIMMPQRCPDVQSSRPSGRCPD